MGNEIRVWRATLLESGEPIGIKRRMMARNLIVKAREDREAAARPAIRAFAYELPKLPPGVSGNGPRHGLDPRRGAR